MQNLSELRLIFAILSAVSCVKSSLFFPVIPYILQFLVFCFWGAVAVMILSSGRPHFYDDNDKICDPEVCRA